MAFLRNCWYIAGFVSDIIRTPIARTLLNEPVLLYRREDGGVVAMSNRCAHRMAPLDRGSVVGDDIKCPYHGLQFGPDGACTKLPSGGLAPPRARLQVYPVVERHAMAWIWMGEPALADPGTIPDFACVENPEFGWFDGYLHVKGNYQLMVDNLMDLSHAEFLHPMLASPGWSTRARQSVTQQGHTVTVRNVAENDNILPIMAQLKPSLGKIGTSVQVERWDPPSHLYLGVDYHSGDDSFRFAGGHFLTPETEKTCHYFVRGGQGLDPGNSALNASMKEGVMAIFQHEDLPIIEAQQVLIGDGDLLEHDPAILENDAGSTRARRLMRKLIAAEQVRRHSLTTGAAA